MSGGPPRELSLPCPESADGEPSDCLTKRRTPSLWLTRLPSGRTKTRSKALEVLTKDGTAVSAAVRSALIDAARRKAGAAIRAEAESLAEDEYDRAVAMQVLRDMETLRAW